MQASDLQKKSTSGTSGTSGKSTKTKKVPLKINDEKKPTAKTTKKPVKTESVEEVNDSETEKLNIKCYKQKNAIKEYPMADENFKKFDYIYLIRTREHLVSDQKIFKIGKTTQTPKRRLNGYPKNSKVLLFLEVNDCHTAETELLQIFRSLYIARTDIGAEYFEGCPYSMMSTIMTYYSRSHTADIHEGNPQDLKMLSKTAADLANEKQNEELDFTDLIEIFIDTIQTDGIKDWIPKKYAKKHNEICRLKQVKGKPKKWLIFNNHLEECFSVFVKENEYDEWEYTQEAFDEEVGSHLSTTNNKTLEFILEMYD